MQVYAITATAAPVAAVFVRTGPWVHVARWDLDRTAPPFGGAWLRGTIYQRRSDVSPDGQLLYCFGLKGGRPFHAVSRLPYLAALAYWRDSDTYSRGAHFERIPARGDSTWFLGEVDDGDVAPLAARHRLALRPNAVNAYDVELRRGWTEHADCPPRARGDVWDERRAQVLERVQPQGHARLVLVDRGYVRGRFEGRAPSYRLEPGGELPGVTWADWDARGRLLVATKDGAVEIRAGGKVILRHSFAGVVPDPQPAPAKMRRW